MRDSVFAVTASPCEKSNVTVTKPGPGMVAKKALVVPGNRRPAAIAEHRRTNAASYGAGRK